MYNIIAILGKAGSVKDTILKQVLAARAIDLNETLAWEHVDIMVSKDFLKREYNNALNAKVTKNCRTQCAGCGANKFDCGVCFEK